jgi:hypothetical protein
MEVVVWNPSTRFFTNAYFFTVASFNPTVLT